MKKQDLLTALETVKPGLASKEMIEQSTSFAFMNGRVVTYNDEISISYPVTDLDIEGAIQAEELYKLLNRLKDDEIEIKLKKNELLLQCGKVEAGLTLQKEIKLPLEEIGEQGKFKKLPEGFLESIRRAVTTCSSDMSRPVLTCVYVSKEGVVVGSDSFCITKCQVTDEEGVDVLIPVKEFLLPASAAVQVIRLKPTKIATGDGWVHFQTDEGTVLSCRVFNDTYPDYKPFMNVEGVEIKLPNGIEEILNRATVFAKRDHFMDERITISLEDKKILVESKSDAGWFKETARVRYNDSPVSFSITPYLIIDILKDSTTCILSEDRLKFEGVGWEYITILRENS